MRFRNVTICGLVALLLTSCAAKGPAPKVHMFGLNGGAGSLGAHTVERGDTISGVAGRYGVRESELLSINNLKSGTVLQIGQRLRIPPPENYKVRKGDTIYSLSRLFEMAPEDIAALNKISGPYMLQPGQTVTLSRQKLAQMVEQSLARPQPPVLPAQKPAAVAAHTVAPPPSTVAGSEGGFLQLPPDYYDRTGQAAASANKGGDGYLQPTKTYPPVPQAPATKSTQVAAGNIAPKPVPSVPAGKFLQPVRGRVVASFGELPDGRINDGINIEAPFGTPVQAAQDGEIAYAGGDLAGYGNLVLVRHRGDYVTVYAHMARIDVKKGQMVRQGEQIGTVGQSGAVKEPQLHFEVRQGRKTRNPAGLMHPL